MQAIINSAIIATSQAAARDNVLLHQTTAHSEPQRTASQAPVDSSAEVLGANGRESAGQNPHWNSTDSVVHHTQVNESFVRGDAAQETNGIALQTVLEATDEGASSQETATPSEEETAGRHGAASSRRNGVRAANGREPATGESVENGATDGWVIMEQAPRSDNRYGPVVQNGDHQVLRSLSGRNNIDWSVKLPQPEDHAMDDEGGGDAVPMAWSHGAVDRHPQDEVSRARLHQRRGVELRRREEQVQREDHRRADCRPQRYGPRVPQGTPSEQRAQERPCGDQHQERTGRQSGQEGPRGDQRQDRTGRHSGQEGPRREQGQEGPGPDGGEEGRHGEHAEDPGTDGGEEGPGRHQEGSGPEDHDQGPGREEEGRRRLCRGSHAKAAAEDAPAGSEDHDQGPGREEKARRRPGRGSRPEAAAGDAPAGGAAHAHAVPVEDAVGNPFLS